MSMPMSLLFVTGAGGWCCDVVVVCVVVESCFYYNFSDGLRCCCIHWSCFFSVPSSFFSLLASVQFSFVASTLLAGWLTVYAVVLNVSFPGPGCSPARTHQSAWLLVCSLVQCAWLGFRSVVSSFDVGCRNFLWIFFFFRFKHTHTYHTYTESDVWMCVLCISFVLFCARFIFVFYSSLGFEIRSCNRPTNIRYSL